MLRTLFFYKRSRTDTGVQREGELGIKFSKKSKQSKNNIFHLIFLKKNYAIFGKIRIEKLQVRCNTTYAFSKNIVVTIVLKKLIFILKIINI